MGLSVGRRWRRGRWRLYAPVYDLVARPFEAGREQAIENLGLEAGDEVLILGSGTGLDLQYLSDGVEVTAVDTAPTMVRRTQRRAERLDVDVDAQVGDAQDLPFADDSFDAVLLHLVLTVVPEPGAVLAETKRVLAPDGRVSVYDKFVPDDTEPSLLRRALDPVARVLFSAVTTQLGPMLAGTELVIAEREWLLGGFYSVAVLAPADGG